MQLVHLALTVIEDPDHDGAYHWLLLQTTGDGELQEHSASDSSFPTAREAFQAGALGWTAALNREDEDADPVGGDVDARQHEDDDMPTPDKLKEAFEAWRRAVDEHVDMMRTVTGGERLDPDAMAEQMDAIDVLHMTWMDMAGKRDGDRKGDA